MDIFNIWKLAGMLSVAALPVLAKDPYSCAGNDPDWTLEITGDAADFSYVAAERMDIPQQTTAEGRDWPKALTLLGGRDTAIVILNDHVCSTSEITDYPLSVNILTQTGESPVILAGCCITP